MGRIYTASRIPQAGGITAPTDLATLALWVTGDMGSVSSWTDQSGGAHHLLQATGSKQPTIVANAINGRPAFLFDGVSQFMKATSFTLTQPETVFIVYKSVSLGAINVNDGVFDGDAGLSMAYIACSTGGFRTDITAGTTLTYDVSVANGAYEYVTTVFNGTSSKIRSHGVERASGDAGAGNAGGFIVGAIGAGASRWTNISVAEIVVYGSRLSDPQILAIENYLANKYGL